MLASIMLFVNQFISMAAAKWGVVGMIFAVLLTAVPVIGILIEVLETVVLLTASTKDDEAAKKIKYGWEQALKVIEFLPHFNVPVAPAVASVILYIAKGTKAILAALKAWRDG